MTSPPTPEIRDLTDTVNRLRNEQKTLLRNIGLAATTSGGTPDRVITRLAAIKADVLRIAAHLEELGLTEQAEDARSGWVISLSS